MNRAFVLGGVDVVNRAVGRAQVDPNNKPRRIIFCFSAHRTEDNVACERMQPARKFNYAARRSAGSGEAAVSKGSTSGALGSGVTAAAGRLEAIS